MNLLQALEQMLLQFLQSALAAVAPVIVSWFQKHVLPNSQNLQGLSKESLRAEARQWVVDCFTELGNALLSKNILPSFSTGFVPLLEAALEQAVDAALDKAGL